MATITTLTFRSAPGTAGDDVPWPVWLQGHSHRGHFHCGMSWASGMAALMVPSFRISVRYRGKLTGGSRLSTHRRRPHRVAAMELRLFIEPQQGASYADQLAVARKAEECGFPAFFRSDHLLVMGDGDGLPGPTDTWTTLAGLARDTNSIRLGTLVTSATFRHPGLLAVQVAQVDEMSGGRVELGLGAGWSEQEHAAYGIPFPESVGERFDRLEEQLAIITGLWETPVGERFTHEGKHYTLVDSPALPKPVQTPVPIVIGGTGRRRTPELAGRYASDFNLPFVSVQESAGLFENVRVVAGAAGRDLSTLTLSNALAVCAGRDETEARRRAAAIGRDLDDLRHDGLAGSPDEIVDKIGQYADVGTSRIYLQVLDLHDLDHLELIASGVMNQLS